MNKYKLDSDHFYCHLGYLIEHETIEKSDGYYSLTSKGLEIAGMLDHNVTQFVKRPKLGVSIFVMQNEKILLGRRKKDPVSER